MRSIDFHASRRVLLRVFVFFLYVASTAASGDWRNIRNGLEIPSEGYADQPYVVITKDGDWLCTLTTGRGREGDVGQHVVAAISSDKGRTWSELIDIEPADGPEASWAMPLVTPSGRVYAFYDYNGNNVRTLPNGKKIRADMLGWYCYRYSDDSGRTWSERFRLPVRVTACDRANDWSGAVQIMWGIGKPISFDGSLMFAFTKLGRYMLDNGEGWFFRSDNILTEREVSKIRWEMLPEGQHGVRNEQFGSVQEEHNVVALSNGDLYCMYRTTTGHPVHCYSRDGGRRWSKPEIATYAPGGQPFKHPRACPRIWRAKNGRFLFWFHNHGGKDYKERNPAWVCGGIEKDGLIYWSQPEILLYDPDPETRISYPDLIEQDGRYWVTETQKEIARVHEIDRGLFEGLWRQAEVNEPAHYGMEMLLRKSGLGPGRQMDMVSLPALDAGGGFSIGLWMRCDRIDSDTVLLDSRDDRGRGICIRTTEVATARIEISDGTGTAAWDCDPGAFDKKGLHHVVFIVDGGPKIISVVADGVLCDGGEHRQYGWGRFRADLGNVSGKTLRIGGSPQVSLEGLRIYDRAMRTSEAIGNFRAGPP